MNHPTQPHGQAQDLNSSLVSVIATDYGGYAVTLMSPQLAGCARLPPRPRRVTSSSRVWDRTRA
jgi:hypothetical protein